MKSVGAWLIIAFGCVLTVGDLGAGSAQVGVSITACGNSNVGVGSSFSAIPPCQHGDISVTKTVVGSGTAPAGGWTVTLSSTDCPNSLTNPIMTIPSTGGVVTFSNLFVTTDAFGGATCHYAVTETGVTDWTPSFAPAGPSYTVTANQTTNIALTNTFTGTTTTTAPATTTTTPATTTTTELATTTSAAAQPITPTTPAAVALPATGSRTARPSFYIGLGFILLGTLVLISRRRNSQPTSN